MPASFSLDSRVSSNGEYPIRVYWSFRRERFQSTVGFSVQKCNWHTDKKRVRANTVNFHGVASVDINSNLERIVRLSVIMEQNARTKKLFLSKEMMKGAITDALSGRYAKMEEIAVKWFTDYNKDDQDYKFYFMTKNGDYYGHLCYAFDFITGSEFAIFQKLTGNKRIFSMPSKDFNKSRSIKLRKGILFKFVSENEALGIMK